MKKISLFITFLILLTFIFFTYKDGTIDNHIAGQTCYEIEPEALIGLELKIFQDSKYDTNEKDTIVNNYNNYNNKTLKDYNKFTRVFENNKFILQNYYFNDIHIKVSDDNVLIERNCNDDSKIVDNKRRKYNNNQCIKFTNPLNQELSFFKVIHNDKRKYSLKGIFDTTEKDLFLKTLSKSGTYKYYYPEARIYPIRKNTIVVDKNSQAITCPTEHVRKFNIGDCIAGYGRITNVDDTNGVYKIKILNETRTIASTVELIDHFAKLKNLKRLKKDDEIYFYEQESLEKISCY